MLENDYLFLTKSEHFSHIDRIDKYTTYYYHYVDDNNEDINGSILIFIEIPHFFLETGVITDTAYTDGYKENFNWFYDLLNKANEVYFEKNKIRFLLNNKSKIVL